MSSVGIMAAQVQKKGFKFDLGNNVATTSGTTVVITTTNPIAVGDLVVVRVAADNLNATTPTFTCADSGSNSYTTHRQGAVNATAAAGVAGAIMCSLATNAVAAGGTITVTCSGAVAARAAYATSFIGVTNTTRSTPVGSSGASTAATSGASGTVNAGDLCLGFSAVESRGAVTGDSDTTNGSWSTVTTIVNNATGTDATRVEISGQYKIATASGAQTLDHTVTSTDWVAGLVVLQAA